MWGGHDSAHTLIGYKDVNTHRQIFRSSAIIGSSSAISIIVGIAKVKIVAIFFGPAGVGLMGLYQNILAIASTLAGCGISNSGVRQIAASADDAALFVTIRRALWMGSLVLGLFGMATLWLFREVVSEMVFGSTMYASDVGWLGLGVLLTLIANSQTALLQGLRRISDMAWVTVQGSIIGAALGMLVIWLLGRDGVIWFVLVSPATSVIVAIRYVSRLPPNKTLLDWQAISHQWRAMLTLGIPLMAAGLLALVTQLCARSLIQQKLGLEASGHFQAVWAISMSYISFALGAMAADYFPRLSAAIHDRGRASQLINEQTEVVLLLAGPILLAMLTLSPWVIQLLYAKSFTPASEMLRWQIMGDIVKIMSWPMGFVIMALGRGGIFFATELIWSLVYLVFIWFGLDRLGVLAAGVGYFAAYIVLLIVYWVMAIRLINFSAMTRNIWLFAILWLAAGVILISTFVFSTLTYALGMLVTFAIGIYCMYRINHLLNLREWLRQRIRW